MNYKNERKTKKEYKNYFTYLLTVSCTKVHLSSSTNHVSLLTMIHLVDPIPDHHVKRG